MDEGIVRAVRGVDPALRETMRMDPIGDLQEKIIGAVRDIHHTSLVHRFAIEADTVGAATVEKQVGSLNVTQITIMVDEIDIDPDAIDFMSYTVWCSRRSSRRLSKETIVAATIVPKDFFKIGRRWIVEFMETLS